MPAICNEIIDDIEDLISSQDLTPKDRYSTRRSVTLRARKAKQSQQPQSEQQQHDLVEQQPEQKQTDDVEGNLEVESVLASALNKPKSTIPGTETIYVKTWGCAHNSSDSEYMAGQLAAYGYNLTENKNEADLWLLNSCTVKNPAEDHFRNDIADGQRLGKHVVVAGCVPQGAPKAQFLTGLSVVGVQQIDRVVEVVEETLKGNSVRLLGQKKSGGRKMGGASLELPKVRRNALIEIIAINTGCLNQCTYCKTKHARGELGSYPPEEIIQRAKQSFDQGVREIWLTSEDTGTYGRDIGTSLPELLWKLVEVIPEGCMLRLGMTNPPYILEHLEEMSKILAHPRVYSFLHVPVQSGSDAVLSDMKREYCRSDFERVVDFLKERISGVTIATDIICGFPTETDSDFQETMLLCEKYRFPSLFINQFFPRPGTPAAKMPRQATTKEVKKRTKQLSEFFKSYEPYGHKVGEIQDVLVTESSSDDKYFVGHNKFYEQVLVPKELDYFGQMIRVEILSAHKHCMIAKPIGLAPNNPETPYPKSENDVGLRRRNTKACDKSASACCGKQNDTDDLRKNVEKKKRKTRRTQKMEGPEDLDNEPEDPVVALLDSTTIPLILITITVFLRVMWFLTVSFENVDNM